METAHNPPPAEQIGLVGELRPSSWTNHMLDWIALADPKALPDPSVRLYWLLKSFIIEDKGQDGERIVQIVQEDLADMLHRSVDSIQRALKPLYKLGLVEDKERRKVSVRVPGKKKPSVTTLLIMQINEPEPPAGYLGWTRPFDARRDVRARRAATQAATEAETTETAGQSDAADLRRQTKQAAPAAAPATPKPVDHSPSLPTGDVSAGQCDTADLLQNGADLPGIAADLRCIGNNPSGSNLSGTGGRDAAPQTPAYRSNGHLDQVVTDQAKLISNHLPARAETCAGTGDEAAANGVTTDPDAEVNWMAEAVGRDHPDLGHAECVALAAEQLATGLDRDQAMLAIRRTLAETTGTGARRRRRPAVRRARPSAGPSGPVDGSKRRVS